jgi:hypothetical protein
VNHFVQILFNKMKNNFNTMSKILGFLNAGRIHLHLYVSGMYLTQCETVLSKIQMFSSPFKMYKIY